MSIRNLCRSGFRDLRNDVDHTQITFVPLLTTYRKRSEQRLAMSQTLAETISQLGRSADALAAIGAALDARANDVALDPAIHPHIEGVLSALGVSAAIESLPKTEIVPVLGQIRTFSLANAKLLFAATRGAGWNHVEPELLQAAGDASAGFPDRLKAGIAPDLDGLAERLAAPGAAFLDIGIGVAALSIAMARRWPDLKIVGIDPWPPAIALARAAVAAAGLADRIELRAEAGEEIADRNAFDLAWLPSLFVPRRQAVLDALARVLTAMRPGAWLLVPILQPSDDPLAASPMRLRVAMFGGWAWSAGELEALLRDKGYAQVRTMASSPQAITALIVGRKE
jgi:SAM-dependent methyltransferase